MLLAEVNSLIFFGVIISLSFVSQYFLHRLNTSVLLISMEEKYPESFISERAYQNLKGLNDLGPKVVGSIANEYDAVNYILNHLRELKANASVPSDISIDHQLASGRLYGNYVNIQNIVVRLQGESDHAVMLNCHFDSVPGSPGASDNIVNCATMIEILRVLTKFPQRQTHTIIFLFNGSEEQGLQAAHAFITQNQWKSEVRAYINLESTGSDGREILFRTGPKHDWLVRMYRESVPRPFGHSVSEELFESGVIPSATDFEIFRDYGEIPGLDFAYVENGWRYHTRYDSVDYISLESIQHTGNNILALTKKIANSNELANPPEGTYAIFFDYLGLFFVSYTAGGGAIFNYIIAIAAVIIPFILQTKFKKSNIGFVVFETLMSFVTIVIATVLAALACWGMAGIMNAVDNTMSWFNTTILSVGIYCSLALLIQIATYHFVQLLSGCCLKSSKHYRVKISLNGVNLFWSIITIGLTAMGFRLGYIPMILLFVSLITYVITYLVCQCLSKTKNHFWVILHLVGHAFSYVFVCYLMLQVHEIFIPNMGKAYISNPDVEIALICMLWMTMTMSYFVPLTLLVKYRALLYSSLGLIFITSTILSFSSIGFPYSGDKDNPRLQRFDVVHLKTTEWSPNNTRLFIANNIVISPWDRNGIRTLENTFDSHDLVYLSKDKQCEDLLFCGLPHFGLNDRVVALKGYNTAPSIVPTIFTLISKSKRNGTTKVEFSLMPRTFTHVSITPMNGLEFKESNCEMKKYRQGERDHLLTSFIVGLYRHKSTVISVEFEGTPESDMWMKIGIVTVDSTFDQGPQETEFKKCDGKVPQLHILTRSSG